jgi:hypothetical protein
MKQESPSRLYGLLGEYETPEAVLAAARRARSDGYRKLDAYTPFPVHGLGEVVDISRAPRVQTLVLVGGLIGGLTGFAMQYFASVIHYPLNVGGRPFNSWPSFIPITFEMTILFAAISAVVGMFVLNKLPMPYHPCFHVKAFARASQDRFFLCIKCNDPRFDAGAVTRLMREAGAVAVHEVPV